jgi:hypothetical protein
MSAASTGPPRNVTVVFHDDDDDDKEEEEEEETGFYKQEIWIMVTREARAVSLWALIAPLFRLALQPFISHACLATDVETCQSSNMSALAGWLLSVFPQTVAQNLAPGFVFASAWLLFAIRDHFGVIPNVPLRICETFMGRMSLRDLCVIMPVHFLCTLSTFMILKLFLPTGVASIALAPVVYSNTNAWFVEFMREATVNCAFTVAFLVMPELFALNKIPRFLTGVVMYPMYSFSADSNDMGSTFGPNVLYALAAVAERSKGGLGQSRARFLGVFVGGFVGGNIMRRYFPDDAKR